MVGFATIAGDTEYHAFRYDSASGQLTDLGTLGGDFSEAIAVSANGQVIGDSYTQAIQVAEEPPGPSRTHRSTIQLIKVC